MTCVKQTFVPSPKSPLEPLGVDPITAMRTQAMVEHGKNTSSKVRFLYIVTNERNFVTSVNMYAMHD